MTVSALARHHALPLTKPGVYVGTTQGRRSLVSSYRYPDNPSRIDVPTVLTGPEAVYRVRIARRVANFGVVVTRRARGVEVEPRVVSGQDENRLTGYAGLPFARNPYLDGAYFTPVPASGALSPAPGVYSVVFDSQTRKGAGPFTFRFWVNDVTPPALRLRTHSVVRGQAVMVAATDAGSGVAPDYVFASVDGRSVSAALQRGHRPDPNHEPHSRNSPLATAGLRLPGDEEHRERRADPSQHAGPDHDLQGSPAVGRWRNSLR